MFKKNTAVTGFVVGLTSSTDGSDITTGTPVGRYTLDGGTQAAIADVTPVHEGNGQWSFDLTAGEMNGDIVGLVFTHASAITQHFTIKTASKLAYDNLELQYDGTGLVGDTFPATQAQVGNISSGTAAQGQNATGAVITTGTETLTYTATISIDGNLHEVAPDGGNTDFYYYTVLPGNSAITGVHWTGIINSQSDTVELQYYDWVAAQFVTEKVVDGSNGSTQMEEEIPAVNSYLGTGANIGEVRFRFLSTTTTNIQTERIRFEFTTLAAESGFEGGMVWIDTLNGVSGTAQGIGIATNPVSNIDDAITIAGNNNLHQYFVPSDSTLTPTGDFNDFTVSGIRFETVLGGHDYSGTHLIRSAPISGIATTATNSLVILEGLVTTMTTDNVYFGDSVFLGTCTFGTSGIVSPSVTMNHCRSGSTTAIFTKTSGATLNLTNLDWKGSLTINGLESGDVVMLSGGELGAITLNGADATVTIGGIAKEVINNLTGSPSVNTDGLIIGSDTALIGSSTLANQIADHAIRRSWANVEASADGDPIVFRSLLGAVAKLVNKVAVNGTDLEIFRDDDTTVLGTQALTTDAAADPITGMDTV